MFDIHAGGIDLVFPHHENEIAQSRCAHGTPVMANLWMHNGFLQVEGEKMSKSLGNFVTINELLDDWGGSVLRLNMLKTQYRQPIDWTEAGLKESGRELFRWADLIDERTDRDNAGSRAVVTALCDDLNTAEAITCLRGFYREKDAAALRDALEFLGVPTTAEFIQGRKSKRLYAEPAQINVVGQTVDLVRSGIFDAGMPADKVPLARELWEMITARNAARKAKDFKEADRIRDELSAMGIQLKDAKDPATGEIVTTWEVKR